ncbi:uncharacterized protein LOC111223887 [Seriola dumerili]|uniref:uncharacterized protein LOC111223887 n=1 Tax=Seriola dumerili TaxID=41447 RepID=UPI000BBE579A|nr:uncharacterized protein LOC111223887 [Seriola dumerili]
MALKGLLLWICSLAVLSSSAAADETVPRNCSSQTQLMERLSADLKVAVECGDNLTNLTSAWSAQQTAAVLLSMRNLADSLHKHQLKGCQSAEPKQCPEAEVPNNGGLACVSVGNNTYCKPLCNDGYDFGFIRRSRLFDKCTEQTRYKWDTQYVGGNKLAVCNEATIRISGAKSAYFPKHQDCLTTKSNSQLQQSIIETFTTELKSKGIQGESRHGCLVCG